MPGNNKKKAAAAAVLIGLLAFSSRLQAQDKPKDADPPARAAQTKSADEIARERRKIVEGIATEALYLAEIERTNCARGDEPGNVREARSEGADFTPDASDECLAALAREANGGKRMELYEKFAKDGANLTPEGVLNVVSAAALTNRPRVEIGNDKSINVSGAVSLDAGYTKGYEDRVTLASLRVANTDENFGKLKVIAEGCLDKDNPKAPDEKTCYVVGRVWAGKENSSKGAK